MYFIWLGYFVLPTAKVVSEEAIHVKCGRNSVVVTWKVKENLVETPSKLLLGDCYPSKFFPTPDGGGEAFFHYHFSDCFFRKTETFEELIYENQLIFRPLTVSDSGLLVYPIKCTTERPIPVVMPTFGVLQGQGELTFHMGILNDDLSGPASSSLFPLGSFINIWASVAQQGHQSLTIYLEECVASNTLALQPQSWIYPLVANKGCLVYGKTGSSWFLPRTRSSSLVLQIQTFKLAADHEVYIHCKLVVWDPDDLSEENKACNYNKTAGSWELLDDPFQNDLCNCCDYDCSHQTKPGSPSDHCCVCQSACSYLPISDQMKSQEQMFFKDPINIVRTHLERIAQIAMFQRNQKERVIAFYKHKFVEMERRLKEVNEQRRRQVSELRKENDELKKPLSQRRVSPGTFKANGSIPRMTLPVAVTSPVTPRHISRAVSHPSSGAPMERFRHFRPSMASPLDSATSASSLSSLTGHGFRTPTPITTPVRTDRVTPNIFQVQFVPGASFQSPQPWNV